VSEDTSLSDHVVRVRRHPWARGTARIGYVLVGVLHLLVAWIAIRVALGFDDGESEDVDQQGALQQLADQPAGGVILWLVAGALIVLALWQASVAVVGDQIDVEHPVRNRIRAGSKCLVHAGFAFTAINVLLGGGGSGDEQAEEGASVLVGSDVGRVVLFLIGLGIVGFALVQIGRGITKHFVRYLKEDELHDTIGPLVVKAGIAGFVGRGLGLVVVGVLVCVAAVQADPEEAGGLDQALTTLAEQPYGPWLLGVIALGFAAFGLYAFGRARYGRI
jgi:hypothetical protein